MVLQSDEPDFLGEFERVRELSGTEIWEIVWRCRIDDRQRRDGKHQTVTVEVQRHRRLGWRIVATDADRKLTARANPDHNLSGAVGIVHWHDLDG